LAAFASGQKKIAPKYYQNRFKPYVPSKKNYGLRRFTIFYRNFPVEVLKTI